MSLLPVCQTYRFPHEVVRYLIYLPTKAAADAANLAYPNGLQMAPDDAVAIYGPYGTPNIDTAPFIWPQLDSIPISTIIGNRVNSWSPYVFPRNLASFVVSYDYVVHDSLCPDTDSGFARYLYFYTYQWVGTFLFAQPSTTLTTQDGTGTGVPAPPKIGNRRWACGFEIPQGGEGAASFTPLGTARDASRTPDGLGLAYRASVNEVAVAALAAGDHSHPTSLDLSWERFYVRLRTLPVGGNDCIWACYNAAQAGPQFVVYVTPAGALAVYYQANAAAPGVLLSTSNAIPLNTWYRIDIHISFQTLAGVNTGQILVYLNGGRDGTAGGTQSIVFGVHSQSKLGNIFSTASHGLECDLDDWVNAAPAQWPDPLAVPPVLEVSGLDLESGSHIQLVRPTGRGLLDAASWNGDWRTLITPFESSQAGTSIRSSTVVSALAHMTTDFVDQQLGVGSINVGIRTVASAAAASFLGYDKGGGTVLVPITPASGSWSSIFATVPAGTALPITKLPKLDLFFQRHASAGTVSIRVLNATVEYIGAWGPEDDSPNVITRPVWPPRPGIHNSAYPNVAVSADLRPSLATVHVRSGVYTGNGTGLDLPIDVPIHWLWLRPLGTTAAALWTPALDTSHTVDSEVQAPDVVERVKMTSDSAGVIQIANSNAASNTVDMAYQWVAVSDPAMRYLLTGAFAHLGGLAAVANALPDPHFAPDALFVTKELQAGATAPATYFKGPGHTGTIASPLNGATVAAVVAMAQGVLTSSPVANTEFPQSAYAAWRKEDGNGFATKLFDVITYTGDGAATRDLTVNLDGESSLFVLVVPHNGVSYFRDPGHTGVNSQTVLGTAVTTGIRNMSLPNTVTVGITLNAVGIVYELFAIANIDTLPAGAAGGCPFIVFSPPTLPNGSNGVAYAQTIVAAGGTGPFTYSVGSGALPTGLALGTDGTLTGIPTANGLFTFTVQTVDPNGCTGSGLYSIRIGTACPVISLTPLGLATPTLGTPYNQVLVANGGTPLYHFAITGGALPPGLALSDPGVITGTPTTVGPFTFTVTATDANGCPGVQIYTLIVGTGRIIVPPCTSPAVAVATLASRLKDPGLVHWTSPELLLCIQEAFRVWNAFTAYFKDTGVFQTQAGEAIYDLPTVLPLLRGYNLTVQDLISRLEYDLMEPQTAGDTWAGSAQFTLDSLTEALNRRRDQFFRETHVVLTRLPIAVTPSANGRVTLPDTVVNVRRAAWIAADGTVTPLYRDDEWALTSFTHGWPQQTGIPPVVYSVGVTPPFQIQLAMPPVDPGTLDLVVVARGTTIDTPGLTDPIVLGIPDDWAWILVFGVLADLLSQDGLALDPQRAAYAQSRWTHGIGLILSSPVVLTSRINGAPIPLASLSDADVFSPTWQTVPGAPIRLLLAGQTLVAVLPPPGVPPQGGSYALTCDVVRNAPIPFITDDCLQAGADLIDVLLDYAHHRALFKEGGAQLQQSFALLNRFMAAAGTEIKLQTASIPNRAPTEQQTAQDGRQVPSGLSPQGPAQTPQTDPGASNG